MEARSPAEPRRGGDRLHPSPPAGAASSSARRPMRVVPVDATAAAAGPPPVIDPTPAVTHVSNNASSESLDALPPASLSSLLATALLPDDDDTPRPLTLRMIQSCTGGDEDSMLHAPVLRLSWLNITALEHLDLFTHVSELYLQHNRLASVEGIQALINLTFLALGHNRLTALPDLTPLRRLDVLDVSHNALTALNAATMLPRSLQLINAGGNPVAATASYRADLIAALPQLTCIDMIDIDDSESEDGGLVGTEAEGKEDAYTSAEDDVPDALLDASRALEDMGIADMQDRFAARRAEIIDRYATRVAVEVARVTAASAAAAQASDAALTEATTRLHSLRAAMSARVAEREAMRADDIALTVKAFKSIGGRDAAATQ